MAFEIQVSSGGDEKLRKAFRTKVPGLTVRFEALSIEFDVKDLSATGFAILDPEKGLTEGDVQECALLIKGKLFISGIKAEIMRVLDNGIVGVNFVELELKKQGKLDKLVLEVQKRLIELRKKQREQE